MAPAPALPSPPMDLTTRPALRPLLLLAAAALALALLLPAGSALADDGEASGVVLAAEERERRPIAPTQRDQLGLVLYGLMAVATIAAAATLRRQLRGDRPQSDGEFRWR